MYVEKLKPQCISCLKSKHLGSYPDNFSEKQKKDYMKGVMKAMLSLVLGEDCDTAAVTNDNCNVAVFSWNGKKWSLLAWNYAGWL